MNRAGLGIAAAVLIGIALASGSAVVSAQPVSNNYVPATIVFTGLDPGRVVCVIGYSQQALAFPVSGFPSITIPSYYLTASGWLPAAGQVGNLAALQVGMDVSSIPSAPSVPSGSGYLNGGTLSFYVVPKGVSCSTITFPWLDSTKGLVTTTYYAYSAALAEISIYPKPDADNIHVSNYMTVDASAVNDFQFPFEVAVESNARTVYAYVGNNVISPLINLQTAVTGPPMNGMTGGATSPLYGWLKIQPGPQAAIFENLALASPPYPYAYIISPDHYLQLKCAPIGGIYIPTGCNIPATNVGQLLNFNDPLNSYYDTELKTFFDGAASSSTKLVVMGDAYGTTYSASPWTVSGYTACPLYLTPPSTDHSLLLTAPSIHLTITVCDPLGQLVPLDGASPSISQIQLAPGNPNPQTATITLSAAQCTQASKYMGWNFGQPSSGFIGFITGINCGQQNTMTLTVLNGPGTYIAGVIGQKVCYSTEWVNPEMTQNNCPQANPNWPWAFSNVAYVGGVNAWQTASDMVLANNGAFGGWESILYSGAQQIIAASIERNIAAAFNRGIANCNNVTMSSGSPPAYCAKVTALTSMNPKTALTASDAYWSNATNWYPSGGPNNYYAQWAHTFQLPRPNNPAMNLFALPQPVISGIANSNQNIPMGMAYGFGYDESPGYTTLSPAPQIPPKFDPIPSTWFTPVNSLQYVEIMIGRSTPPILAQTHDFNNDGRSDIPWRDMGGNVAIWEMNGTTVLNPNTSGVGPLPTSWFVDGVGDYNGDGKSDMLLRDTAGDVAIWLMNGTKILNPGADGGVGNVPTNWTVVGVGDFNGDGKADILWHDTAGDVAIWEMNATQILNPTASFVQNVPSNWSIVGVGDFNGDGFSDILWYSTGGDVAIWLMNGTTILNPSTSGVTNLPANWGIYRVGDYDGDGKSDMLLRDTAGDVAIWLMNGTTIRNPNAAGVQNVPINWSIVGTGDFNGDGMSDILWRNTLGDVSIWEMNATQILNPNTAFVQNVPTNWTVQLPVGQ